MVFGPIQETVDRLRTVEETIGDFIAGDGPDSDLAEYVREKYQRNCRSYSNAPDWLVGMGPAGQAVGRMCKRYLDENNWSDVENSPPFTGGQCNARYIVYAVRTRNNGQGPPGPACELFNDGEIQVTEFIRGPLSLVTSTINEGGGLTSTRWTLVGSQESVILGTFADGCPGAGFSNFRFEREFGAPDNCGDPPSEIRPGPNPAPNPGPIPEEEEPRPDPDDPSIPNFPIPDFPDPIFGPTPTVGPGGGGGGYPGPQAPTVGDPIENDDGTGGQDEDFGEPPEGEEWVGAFLELTFVPDAYGAIAGSGPENTVFPRVVGNASLYGGGNRYTANQVRSRWSDHFTEIERLPVSGLRVTVLPNVRYRVIPVSLPVPEEE